MPSILLKALWCLYSPHHAHCSAKETEAWGQAHPTAGTRRRWAEMQVVLIEDCCRCCSMMSDSVQHHGLQDARPCCPSLSPRVCPSSFHWICDAIQPSHPLSAPSAFNLPQHQGFFLMNRLFSSSGQSVGASTSASLLPKSIQDWFPLGLAGLISLLSKGLSSVSSSTI